MSGAEAHMSLVERKKRQWAEERAEMESLCSPWGLPPPAYSFRHQQNRNRFASSLEIRDTCPPTAQQNLIPRRQRSPSLPPILGNQECAANQPSIKQEVQQRLKSKYEDGEGETSGYASDSVPQSSPEYWQKQYNNGKSENKAVSYCKETRNYVPVQAWHHSTRNQEERIKRWTGGSSTEEQRAKWGDRGVATGRLWEPQDPDARLPQVPAKGTPTWIERSLNMIDNGDSQILIIDQQSSHSLGNEAMEYNRAMSEQQEKNTYLLGQNVPLEPNVKAEREYKRLKALELQAAIVQQLEDRERKKREEKERRIKEEREEEERFRRQQELERQRLEDERRVVEEKKKREQKRTEALRVALERAEQQAKLEKENKKNKKLREQFDSMSINSESNAYYENASPTKEANRCSSMQNIHMEQTFSPRKIMNQDQGKLHNYQNSSETNIVMSNPQSRFSCHTENEYQMKDAYKRLETPRQVSSDTLSSLLHNGQPVSLIPEQPLSLVQIPISQEVFTPVSFSNHGAVQMALLVPQNVTSVCPCVHQPMSMQALLSLDTNNQQRNSFHLPLQTDTDECMSHRDKSNKLLTPSKYRNPNHRDASTQTDPEPTPIPTAEEKSKRKDLETEQNTSEEKLNSSNGKKEKRVASEDRVTTKELENRPKWGVNKPPMQYKKQSEKDIFYTQKRKLRQRKRMQEKQYTSHSSDDNRSPSPAKNGVEKTRVSLSDYHWRKKGMKSDKSMFPINATVETTQILPLECDQSGIVHVGLDSLNYPTQKRLYNDKKSSSLKRGITLSQKFMNDKYGNPKMWQEDVSNEVKSKYEEDINVREKTENRKKYVDNLNSARRERSLYYRDDETNQPLILDQLRSLRDSLKKQQQIWGKYESRRSPSPKNEVDLEME